ncbi:putative oxidoreductase,short chain dehydrogenase [Stipitochalara longipes BDJ]|nr:putative oxidoreductase,short chain dehydrogenase [Stipitochalara longipes BDJ]
MLERIRNSINQTWPPHPPTFTEANVLPGSEKGRVFIVTGGNSGIGFELCKILYTSGATIYMASRTQAKAEAAIKTITASSSSLKTNGHLKFLHLDLNDLLSVKSAAATFASQETKLDVLWNNAGQGPKSVKPGQKTVQGFEPMIGMHCIATLLFTELLVPQLRAAARKGKAGRTRVVWTSSGMAEEGSPNNGIDFSALDNGTGNLWTNYGHSKFGTWLLGREFAQRYGGDGIVSVVQNPGNAKGGSYAGSPRLMMVLFNAFVLQETVFGAYTELYAGLSGEIGVQNNGTYVIPWGRVYGVEEVPRKDLVKALKTIEEGGLEYGEKFWGWCEEKWEKFI